MSRDMNRKAYFPRDPRDPRERRDNHPRDRDDYRGYDKHRPMPKRSPSRGDGDKQRSRSPLRMKTDKDLLDENILREISKLPEPSELWDNHFQDNNFPPPLAPQFKQEMPTPGYPPSYPPQPTYSGIYDDFPPIASVPAAPQPPEWNQMSLPPHPGPSTTFIPNIEDQMKKEAAIESEMRHQKAALSKQREDYMKKAGILKKELDTLKDQRNELRGDSKRSPSPDTKRFLKENTKLQLEIQNKLKTINNVVDMLNGIIGEEAHQVTVESDDEADRPSSKRKSRSPSSNKKFNYVYYDPEMHWCRVCNEFPPTAKDYLNHLHSAAHHKMAAQHLEAPWHSVSGMNEGFPGYPNAPTKRTPIRGLQFFVPSTAWYCKLCDQFIGDLHCASAHLKSIVHSKNYTNFVEQNPHWETDWMSDRQKSLEKCRAAGKVKAEPEKPQQYTAHTITFHKEGFHTKNRKESPPPAPVEEKKKKEKKKKSKKRKRDSSSSSSSESSSSESEAEKKKKKKKDKEKSKDANEKVLSDWMSQINSNRLSESDRKILDSLKSKMKEKEERRSPDRARERERERSILEATRKIRESERRGARADDRRSHENARRRDDRDMTRADKPTSPPAKKPEVRKMPFIGKMPVYKSLSRSKTDEQKKEDQKKKDDDDAAKKRREEMDAEIQKKVAEFKEKIAKAQLEREQSVNLPPPAVALPTELGGLLPAPILPQPVPIMTQPPPPAAPAPAPAPAPAVPAVPNLPKDFQDALDIIFPTGDKKTDLSTDLFTGMPSLPGFPPGLPLPGMTPFPPIMPGMPFMNPFDMNPSLFQPRPQLYDTHVPLNPSSNPRPNKTTTRSQNYKQNKINANKNQNQKQQQGDKSKQKQNAQKNSMDAQAQKEKNGGVDKKKEELDELAMLGIDASDVGASI